jgi:hypothetical protein
MALSGSITYTKNTTSVIEDAFDELGILGEGESLTSSQSNKAKRKLNAMIQGWEADGVHLWKYREATLFLEKGVQSYLLGNSQGNATESFAETTTSAAAVLGANTIVVTSATGIVAGYFIGIELDDGTAQWTTVVSVVSTTVTLNDVLTDSVASGNQVKSYQTKITKPVKITQCRYVADTTNEIECVEYDGRSEYFRQSNKSTEGASTNYYYNPLRLDTRLYTWPTADQTFRLLKFTYYPDFNIFDDALDEPDIPAEWYECLVFNLAERLGPSYGISEDTSTYRTVARRALEMYNKLNGFDSDDGVLRIMNSDYSETGYNVY